MKPLYKTTIVIWSEYNGTNVELSTLASQVENGDAYCSVYRSSLIENPSNDPDWDNCEFFDDGEPTSELEPLCQEDNPYCRKGTRGNYVTCVRCRRILCDGCDMRIFSADYYNMGDEREYELEEPHCFACRMKWLDEWEECGSCGCDHPPGYHGDCRNDMMRRP